MGSLVSKFVRIGEKVRILYDFEFFRKIDVIAPTLLDFYIELKLCNRMKVLHTFKLIKSEIKLKYQKSSSMMKPKLINLLFRIGEILRNAS